MDSFNVVILFSKGTIVVGINLGTNHINSSCSIRLWHNSRNSFPLGFLRVLVIFWCRDLLFDFMLLIYVFLSNFKYFWGLLSLLMQCIFDIWIYFNFLVLIHLSFMADSYYSLALCWYWLLMALSRFIACLAEVTERLIWCSYSLVSGFRFEFFIIQMFELWKLGARFV